MSGGLGFGWALPLLQLSLKLRDRGFTVLRLLAGLSGALAGGLCPCWPPLGPLLLPRARGGGFSAVGCEFSIERDSER